MWWTAAIQAGLSLFGASRQDDAARESKKIAALNVKAQQAETQESLRRHRAESRTMEGYAKTAAAASGFSYQEGTSGYDYVQEMVAENRRQRTFMGVAGERQAGILAAGGELAYRQGKASAIGSTASAISSIGNMWSLGQDQNWSLWGG